MFLIQLSARKENCRNPEVFVSYSEGGVEDPKVVSVNNQVVVEGSARILCEFTSSKKTPHVS